MSKQPAVDPSAAAKSGGFSVRRTPKKRGKNEWELVNSDGIVVQMGDSEADVYSRAINRGIINPTK